MFQKLCLKISSRLPVDIQLHNREKMAKLGLFLLIVALSNQTSLACNDNKAEQLPGTRRELNDYWVDSYGFHPPSLTPLYYHEASPPGI